MDKQQATKQTLHTLNFESELAQRKSLDTEIGINSQDDRNSPSNNVQ